MTVRSVVDYRTAEVADVAGETARPTAAGCDRRCGTSRMLPACCRSTSVRPGSSWPSGARTSTSTAGPARRRSATSPRDLQATLPQPIWGWFAQTDQFDMGPTFTPQPDIRRLLLGTPSILALAAAEEGIAVTVEAGIEAIEAKARALTGFGLELCDAARPADVDPKRTRCGAEVMSPCNTPTPVALSTELADRWGDHRLPRPRHRPHRLLPADHPIHRRLRRPHRPRHPR